MNKLKRVIKIISDTHPYITTKELCVHFLFTLPIYYKDVHAGSHYELLPKSMDQIIDKTNFTHPSSCPEIDKNASSRINNINSRPKHWSSFYSLRGNKEFFTNLMKKPISDMSNQAILSLVTDLEKINPNKDSYLLSTGFVPGDPNFNFLENPQLVLEIIFESVIYSLISDKQQNLKKSYTPIVISKSLNEAKEVYEKRTNMYSYSTKERFDILTYLVNEERNPYACYELGDFYYYGFTLYCNKGDYYKLPSDKQKASEIWKIGADQGEHRCCWTYGYMIINEFIFFSNKKESEEEAIRYFNIGFNVNYAPSCNNLGLIFYNRALGLLSHDSKSAKDALEKSIKYLDNAAAQGYVYSLNNLYSLFQNTNIKCLLDLIDLSFMQGPKNAYDCIKKSADLGNQARILSISMER